MRREQISILWIVLIGFMIALVGCKKVTPEPVTRASISVASAPDKVEYVEGDQLDLSGFSVSITYSDQSVENVAYSSFTTKGFTVSPESGTVLTMDNSDVVVTDTDNKLTTKQSITVTEKIVTLTGIVVKETPTKIEYNVGDLLDLSGLVLTLSYDNGENIDAAVSDLSGRDISFNIDTAVVLTIDQTKLIFTHNATGTTVEQPIVVTEKKTGIDFTKFAKSFEQYMMSDDYYGPDIYLSGDQYMMYQNTEDYNMFILDDWPLDMIAYSSLKYEHFYSEETGVIEKTTVTMPSMLGSKTVNIFYEYDEENRLLIQTHEGHNTPNEMDLYKLDEFGRIDMLLNYYYYEASGVVDYSDDSVTKLSYDDNDNLIKTSGSYSSEILFTYDTDNRCTNIKYGKQQLSYEYEDNHISNITMTHEADGYDEMKQNMIDISYTGDDITELNYSFYEMYPFKDKFTYSGDVVTKSTYVNDLKVAEVITGGGELSVFGVIDKIFEELDDISDFTADTDIQAIKTFYENSKEYYMPVLKEEWYEGKSNMPELMGSIEVISYVIDEDYKRASDFRILNNKGELLNSSLGPDWYDASGEVMVVDTTIDYSEWIAKTFEKWYVSYWNR